MNPKPRYVLDTSVVVSALLFDASIPGQAFRSALDRGVILASHATFVELGAVLARTKFDKYISTSDREHFLVEYLRSAELVGISEEIRACRDPKDDMFLELSVNGRAECLVTGDADLLALHPFRSIPILTPSDFLRSFQ